MRIGGAEGSMDDAGFGYGRPARRGEPARPLVLETEVFEVPVDPVLELLNQWEEYRRRGEEPPPDWTVAIDAGLREELNRRIERRKRLIALLDLAEPPSDRGGRAGRAAPVIPRP